MTLIYQVSNLSGARGLSKILSERYGLDRKNRHSLRTSAEIRSCKRKCSLDSWYGCSFLNNVGSVVKVVLRSRRCSVPQK